MILPIYLQGIAEALATGILVCIAGGIPIALFAWAALRMSGHYSAGAKFATLYGALIAICLLPVIESVRLGTVHSGGGQPSHSLVTVSSSWAVLVFALWSVLAAIALIRVVAGMVRLRSLRRNSRSVNLGGLDPILQQTLREVSCDRGGELRISDELSVPTAIGFFKPLVILPAWALQDLSATQLRPILLHEFAHVRRWDDWTNLFQKLIQAVLFFHPAVWWIERRISLEREMACDEIVLAHTGNPRAYAQSLLSVAEKSFVRRGFSLAQAAVSRMRQTSARIAQILDGNRQGTICTWKPAWLLVVASLLSGFVVLPSVPNLVGFRDHVSVPSPAASNNVIVKAPEHSIQIATSDAPSPPRGIIHTASFKMRRTYAPSRREDKANAGYNLVEAGFRHDQGYGSSSQINDRATARQPVVMQTVLVVTRFQRDNQSPEFWTIQVWQLTAFTPTSETQNAPPAKKV